MDQHDKASAFPGQSAELASDGKSALQIAKEHLLGSPGDEFADDERERPSEDRSPLT